MLGGPSLLGTHHGIPLATVGGGCGIRTREGLHPARFPSLPPAGQAVFKSRREAAITEVATNHEP